MVRLFKHQKSKDDTKRTNVSEYTERTLALAHTIVLRQEERLHNAGALGFISPELLLSLKVQFLVGVFEELGYQEDKVGLPTAPEDRAFIHLIHYLVSFEGYEFEDARQEAIGLREQREEGDGIFQALRELGCEAVKTEDDFLFLRAVMALPDAGVRETIEDPVLRRAALTVSKLFRDPNFELNQHVPEKLRADLICKIMDEVNEVAGAKNRFLASREKIAGSVLELAKLQVLILPSAAEGEDTTGLRGHLGITGELKSHLAEISEKDDEIREMVGNIGSHDLSPKDIYDSCLGAYWWVAFRAHVLESLRQEVGDGPDDSNNDWYWPFVAAMCAWEESKYRETIGLENTLEGLGPVPSARFYIFLLDVTKGVKCPKLDMG